MSTNIQILATRDVTVDKTGQKSVQKFYFDYQQTTSEVTRQILASDDPIQTYKDWILSISETEMIDVFSEEDIWNETPIGQKEYNWGQEHIEYLQKWVKEATVDGYDIIVDSN